MSRTRASAVFAALVTILAMAAAAVTLTPAAASATRRTHYPPPPPSLMVRPGSVKQNATVHVTGGKYANRERVSVTITYPGQPHRRPVVKTIVVKVGRSGTVSFNLRMTEIGRATITARGSNSHKSATAFVLVKASHGHNQKFRRMALAVGPETPGSTGLTPTTATAPSAGRGLATAGLGVLILIGTAVITGHATRRRRKSNAT
jgi:hypothetical protein